MGCCYGGYNMKLIERYEPAYKSILVLLCLGLYIMGSIGLYFDMKEVQGSLEESITCTQESCIVSWPLMNFVQSMAMLGLSLLAAFPLLVFPYAFRKPWAEHVQMVGFVILVLWVVL